MAKPFRKATSFSRAPLDAGVQAIASLNRGLECQAHEDLPAAERCFRRAVELDGGLYQAHGSLGTTLMAQGRLAEAAACFRRALAICPNDPVSHYNLGTVFEAEGAWAWAEGSYRTAVENDPGFAEAHNNLGVALHEQGRSVEAIVCYQRALACRPRFADAYNNYGAALQSLGEHGAALGCYERAASIRPDFAWAHVNLAMEAMLLGDVKRGRQEYEWRYGIPELSPGCGDRPLWDGHALKHETLLVRAEQGAGDTLQFARYLPGAKERASHVVMECQRGLRALLQAANPGIEVVERVEGGVDSVVPCDFVVGLLSLPRVLQAEPDALADAVPYLRADEGRREIWAARLTGGKAKRVGIVWAGSPTHRNDKNRSCSLADFAALADVPGLSYYSLQKGDAAKQAEAPPEGLDVVDLSGELHDFADTAAALACLDLVITVDTSTAHLAGALGTPVWTLLPFSPDWRWMLDRSDSPWYPSMRLFRQPKPGDWQSVFADVAAALSTLR